MNLDEKLVSSKPVYEGKYLNVKIDEFKLPNEKIVSREIVERPDAACVVALTENREVLMVRQFRAPYKQVMLEIPAGKLDEGEEPYAAMVRELREETGAIGKNYRSMGKLYMTPGYADEIIYMYLCDVAEIKEAQPDEDEFLELVKIPLNQAVEQVLSGEIVDAKTCVAILKAHLILNK